MSTEGKHKEREIREDGAYPWFTAKVDGGDKSSDRGA